MIPYTKEILENISILDFKAYLLANGWTISETIPNKALILNHADNDYEIIVPLDKNLGDYTVRMSESIQILSKFENRYGFDIIKDIQKSGVDIVRIKMLENTEKGTVLLSAISDIFVNAKEMLLSSACSVIEPKRLYGSKRPQNAIDYVNKVRIGQTEYGSFIFTFLSPVAPRLEQTQQNLFPDLDISYVDDPFERQVTQTLSRALGETKKSASFAISEQTNAHFEEAVQYGVSANLCDAITSIIAKVGRTEISFKWSKNRPVKDTSIYHAISFDQDIAEVISEASRIFKKLEPRYDMPITGWVSALQKENSQDEDGIITINALVDNKPKKLKTKLSDEDYQKVIKSHAGNKFISLEGDLFLEGKKSILKNPRNLKLIDSDE